MCEGVNLPPNFLSAGSQQTGPDCCNEPSKGVIVGHYQGILVTISAVKLNMWFSVNQGGFIIIPSVPNVA